MLMLCCNSNVRFFVCLQLYDGNDFYLDPTKEEVDSVDLTDQERNDRGGGLITMGYLPSRDQISLFSMEGKMDPQTLEKAVEVLMQTCTKVFSVVRSQAKTVLDKDGEV